MRNKRSILALAFSLALVVATDAFASRARLLVLGTGDTGFLDGNGNGGSLYINDMYNIFYNPAYVSDYKDMAIIEKWNGNAGAEGGFLTSMSGITFGAYMNRVDGLSPMTNKNLMKPIELFVGGEHVAKWGIRFMYGNWKQRNLTKTGATTWEFKDTNDSEMNLSLGASYMNFDPFFSIKLKSDEGNIQSAPNTPTSGGFGQGKSYQDWTAGVRYTYGEWIPYAAFKANKAGRMTVDKFVKTWGVGFGRTMKGTESVNVNYGLSLWRVNQTRTVIPIEVSVEGKATGWLTLRGGVRYSLVDRLQQIDNANTTRANGNTSGRLGASFNFGRFDVDWAVGSSGTVNTEATDSATFDFSNNLFTAASVSYRW